MDVLFRCGGEKVVVGNAPFGVVDFVFLGKMRINGLSSVANAVLFSEKGLHDFNRMEDVFVVGDTVIDAVLGEFGRFLDATELFLEGLSASEGGKE